jgi:hypothetical protein
MQQRYDAGWVRDENRDAICHSDCEGDPLLSRYVSVGFFAAKPTLPAARVHENTRPVNLTDRDESPSGFGQLVLHGRPSRHDFVDRISAGEAEGPSISSRREGANAPTFEVGDCLLRYFTHATGGDRQRG